MKDILIIVHPGSACGSADMNLGFEEAENQRLEMQCLVQGWEGGVLVIDGEYSDELEGGKRSYGDWGWVIKEALSRAQKAGLHSARMRGDDNEDFDQHCATEALLEQFALTPQSARFTLTGAWYESETGGGCVGGVLDWLCERGFEAKVAVDGVMDLSATPDWEDDADDDLEEEQGSPPRRFRP